MSERQVERYQLPQVPLPVNDDDIASKLYVDTMGGGMSSIQFIQTKEDAGDMIRSNGSAIGAVGSIATITPANGLTFYPVAAKCNCRQVGVGSNGDVELQNDGVSIEKWDLRTGEGQANYQFENMMEHLDGDGIKKYTLEAVTIDPTVEMYGFLQGYVV